MRSFTVKQALPAGGRKKHRHALIAQLDRVLGYEPQIPRIGQEVIVSFLEGDPDRPIITGRVYNAEQTVPYELPANATQSGTKSRSSKGGTPANFNEIRMEDKKGAEQLYRPVTPGVAGSSPVRCAIHFPSRVHHPELAVFH